MRAASSGLGRAAQPQPHRASLSPAASSARCARGSRACRRRGGVTWRAALACLTRPRPARPLFTRQAGPGRRGLGAPPPPGPTKWLGGGEEEAMGVFSRLLGGGRSAGPRTSGSSSSSPSHPLPPLSTCGDPGRRQCADQARRQLSVTSPAGRGGEEGKGRGREGGGH